MLKNLSDENFMIKKQKLKNKLNLFLIQDLLQQH